jgi:hypothetical protein
MLLSFFACLPDLPVPFFSAKSFLRTNMRQRFMFSWTLGLNLSCWMLHKLLLIKSYMSVCVLKRTKQNNIGIRAIEQLYDCNA